MNDSRPGAAFASTQWSIILATRQDTGEGRAALQRFCATYWLPVYSYLRRRGHAPADAEDFTQGFFAYLLESDFLSRPDPLRGRFRSYLIGALRHYLSGHFEKASAQKRGGQAQFVDWGSLNPEQEFSALDRPQADPSAAYERSWAYALLGRALRRLEEEQQAAGRSRQFQVLKSFLSTSPSRGDYERCARELDTSRTNVAVWVHRLNQRYGELVKLEVAATVQDPAEVREEMQHLLQALRS